MSYNDFFHKLHKSQWRDNFSADSIPALYEHLVENNIPTDDIGAIAMSYRDLRVEDIVTEVDFRDYCTASEPAETEELYEYVNPEFWPVFFKWVADNTDDVVEYLSYSLMEIAATVPHDIDVLTYIDSKDALELSGYFDDNEYYTAIAEAYMQTHMVLNQPDYIDCDTVLLTTND